MSVFVPVQSYIGIAKISQYLSINDIAIDQKIRGGTLNAEYSRLLYLVRRSVEKQFSLDPDDESLNDTALYMYALCARYAAEAQIISGGDTCIVPFIVIQPVGATANEGSNVSFSVLAGGTTPFTYQWKKNGVDIPGANSISLTLTGVTTMDNGDYSVVISNDCGQVTSSNATLSVNAAITVSWWYGASDPYPGLSGGTDTITYLGSFNITHNDDISVPFPVGAENNQYEVVRVPIGESTKLHWKNTDLNKGDIPDIAFRDSFIIGSFRYYVSRNAISIDSTHNVIFSVNPL